MDVFLRETEAWEFVRKIPDAKERLLTEIAVATALSVLVTDTEYQRTYEKAPFDLLAYARATHAVFRNRDTIRGVLDGTITSIDDMNPFPTGD